MTYQQPYQAPAVQQQTQVAFPQLDSGLAIPSFLPGDDPTTSLNKAMTFISIAISSRYPTTNNQLRTSSNPGWHGYSATRARETEQGLFIATTVGVKDIWPDSALNQKGQGILTGSRRRYYLFRHRNQGFFLDEEQLAFLADPRIAQGQDTQTTLPINAAFQTDDLNVFNSDCDEAPSAMAVLMANVSSIDSDVISEVPNSDTFQDNSVLDHCVQEMYHSEQPAFDHTSDIEITSDSNIISYDQYMKENESEVVQDTTFLEQQNAMIMSIIDEMSNQVAKSNAVNLENKTVNESLTAELERYKEHIKMFEERKKVDLNDHEKYVDSQMREMIVNINTKFAAFKNKIHTLKLRLSKNIEENKSLTTTMDVLKKETKEKEDKYIEEIVDLEKKKKDIDNIVYKVVNMCKQCILFLENNRLLELIISQDLVHTAVNFYAAIVDYQKMEKSYVDEYIECLELKAELSKKNEIVEKVNAPEFKEFFKINNLKTQLKGKDTTISNLKKHIANLKRKDAADCSKSVNNSRVISIGMYKLDLQPLSSTLKKNKEVHEHYLKVTKEHANTLRGIVEHARDLKPSNDALDYACKYAQRIHELLVCVSASCPSFQKDSEKLVAANTKNKNRRVTFTDNRDTSATITQKR
ncbi:hypothetical protein Tco_0823765 [Tanacetum coccineum]|uniref:Uncharacterized protein n=1 Tax=Tanacetum coccineum TaxID=301880 RepID=A0ABQ5AMV9_9ASTR